ncbi:MAG: CHAD domain-containing protein [Acidobacteriota bacterium]
MTTRPEEPIGPALRTILGALLTKINDSADKVLHDSDPDDIHDLRVATRRTRTLLSQMPRVFADDAVAPFKRGFKRIGNVTGACRDLDVWLEAIDEHREASASIGGAPLDPLEVLMRRQRDTARIRVNQELSSLWFPDLLSRWQCVLETPPAGLSKRASRPTAMVAAARILKAHQRLLKHGNALPEEPLAAQFHRLRIDGKKLRYLLEFFGQLFDADRSHQLIEDLKCLQDVLGGINDREIQLEALNTLTESPDPATAIAIEHHRHFLRESLADFRSIFGDKFRAFADPEVTRSFRRLFGESKNGP